MRIFEPMPVQDLVAIHGHLDHSKIDDATFCVCPDRSPPRVWECTIRVSRLTVAELHNAWLMQDEERSRIREEEEEYQQPVTPAETPVGGRKTRESAPDISAIRLPEIIRTAAKFFVEGKSP